MAKGCDSSWDFDYKSRVDALVDGGYTFIGRYLNHSAGVRNSLFRDKILWAEDVFSAHNIFR